MGSTSRVDYAKVMFVWTGGVRGVGDARWFSVVVFDENCGKFFRVASRRRVVGAHFCLAGKISGKAIAVATPVGFSAGREDIFFHLTQFSDVIFLNVYL